MVKSGKVIVLSMPYSLILLGLRRSVLLQMYVSFTARYHKVRIMNIFVAKSALRGLHEPQKHLKWIL